MDKTRDEAPQRGKGRRAQKTELLAIRTTPSIKNAVRQAAEEAGRTMTEEIEARLEASLIASRLEAVEHHAERIDNILLSVEKRAALIEPNAVKSASDVNLDAAVTLYQRTHETFRKLAALTEEMNKAALKRIQAAEDKEASPKKRGLHAIMTEELMILEYMMEESARIFFNAEKNKDRAFDVDFMRTIYEIVKERRTHTIETKQKLDLAMEIADVGRQISEAERQAMKEGRNVIDLAGWPDRRAS